MSLTVKQAVKLEEAFLGGISEAQDAYEEIVATEAWTVLGYDTFTEWWSDRVAPLMRQLSMFPNRKLAARVIEQVRTDEAELPPAQRRTQSELSELVGQSESAERQRQSRSRQRDMSRSSDLEEPSAPVDPLPPEIAEQIEQRIAERVTRPTAPPIQPADPEVRERLAREREEQQSKEVISRDLARCVWLLAEFGAVRDAADQMVKDWQSTQDTFPKPTTAARLRAAADYLNALAERWPT